MDIKTLATKLILLGYKVEILRNKVIIAKKDFGKYKLYGLKNGKSIELGPYDTVEYSEDTDLIIVEVDNYYGVVSSDLVKLVAEVYSKVLIFEGDFICLKSGSYSAVYRYSDGYINAIKTPRIVKVYNIIKSKDGYWILIKNESDKIKILKYFDDSENVEIIGTEFHEISDISHDGAIFGFDRFFNKILLDISSDKYYKVISSSDYEYGRSVIVDIDGEIRKFRYIKHKRETT